MAVIPIRKLPDPVLRAKAKRVRFIDRSISKLVDDMVETMHDASGVGLAAPQVGVSLRVAVIQVPEQELRVLINPEMVRRSGELEAEEGCLSIPGYKAWVTRSECVVVKAQDLQGKDYRVKADGLLARALQHELDHLNGTLYVDYLDSPDKLEPIGADDDDDTESEAEDDEAPVS